MSDKPWFDKSNGSPHSRLTELLHQPSYIWTEKILRLLEAYDARCDWIEYVESKIPEAKKLREDFFKHD